MRPQTRENAGDFRSASPDRITPWKTRASQVTWVILLERAMVIHSAGASSPRPHPSGDDPAAFRGPKPLGCAGTIYLSELQPHGPRARGPTHSPPRYRDRNKDSLPACRAQLWPGEIRTHWMKRYFRTHLLSFPIDQHCLVASRTDTPTAGRLTAAEP